MDLEQRIVALEKEVAGIKRQLENQPQKWTSEQCKEVVTQAWLTGLEASYCLLREVLQKEQVSKLQPLYGNTKD